MRERAGERGAEEKIGSFSQAVNVQCRLWLINDAAFQGHETSVCCFLNCWKRKDAGDHGGAEVSIAN